MENEEKKAVLLNEQQIKNLEEVPEPFRSLLKAKLEEARSGGETPESSKIAIQKDFQFDFKAGAGLLLAGLLKLLVQISKPVEPPPQDTVNPGAAAAPERPELRSETFDSGAVKPTSSAWVVWLALLGLAAFYFYNRLGQ